MGSSSSYQNPETCFDLGRGISLKGVCVQGRTTCGGVTRVLQVIMLVCSFFTRDKPRVTPLRVLLQFSRALTQSVAVRLRSRVVSFDTTYCQQDLEISKLLFKKCVCA